MDQDETWHGGRPLLWPHCFRWAPSSSPQRGIAPNFRPIVCCGQTVGWIKMPLGRPGGRSRPPGDTLLDGDPAPPPQKGAQQPPTFRPTSIVAMQTAGWIKMPLGMKVGLSPGHIVLHGDPAPSLPQKGHSPQFRPMLLWPNGWIDQRATWSELGLGPADIVLDRDPAPPSPKRGHSQCRI